MNTQKFKRNNLEQLNQFKIGDKIAVHNGITGTISYFAEIVSLSNSCIKDGTHLRHAAIKLSNGVIIGNYLGTAILVN